MDHPLPVGGTPRHGGRASRGVIRADSAGLRGGPVQRAVKGPSALCAAASAAQRLFWRGPDHPRLTRRLDIGARTLMPWAATVHPRQPRSLDQVVDWSIRARGCRHEVVLSRDGIGRLSEGEQSVTELAESADASLEQGGHAPTAILPTWDGERCPQSPRSPLTLGMGTAVVRRPDRSHRFTVHGSSSSDDQRRELRRRLPGRLVRLP